MELRLENDKLKNKVINIKQNIYNRQSLFIDLI